MHGVRLVPAATSRVTLSAAAAAATYTPCTTAAGTRSDRIVNSHTTRKPDTTVLVLEEQLLL